MKKFENNQKPWGIKSFVVGRFRTSLLKQCALSCTKEILRQAFGWKNKDLRIPIAPPFREGGKEVAGQSRRLLCSRLLPHWLQGGTLLNMGTASPLQDLRHFNAAGGTLSSSETSASWDSLPLGPLSQFLYLLRVESSPSGNENFLIISASAT